MKAVAIELDDETRDPVEALKACARQLRDGFGAGSLTKTDPDIWCGWIWLGFWTSVPKSWEDTDFKIDIMIESETDISDYDMAALVESRIKSYQFCAG